jgi:hypothetical protein
MPCSGMVHRMQFPLLMEHSAGGVRNTVGFAYIFRLFLFIFLWCAVLPIFIFVSDT